MRAAVRGISFEPDPRGLPADPADFRFLAVMRVGPRDGPGSETFSVEVCTPEWLAKRCRSEDYVDARHMVITSMEAYSDAGLRAFLTKRAEQATGQTWQEVAEKVSRTGCWEFEDFTEQL